jgi:hypothetical protein
MEDMLGLSDKTVCKAMKSLSQYRLIDEEHMGQNKPNRIYLLSVSSPSPDTTPDRSPKAKEDNSHSQSKTEKYIPAKEQKSPDLSGTVKSPIPINIDFMRNRKISDSGNRKISDSGVVKSPVPNISKNVDISRKTDRFSPPNDTESKDTDSKYPHHQNHSHNDAQKPEMTKPTKPEMTRQEQIQEQIQNQNQEQSQNHSDKKIIEIEAYRKIIRKNIDYEHLIANNKNDCAFIDGLVEIMLDVCVTEKPETIRIASEFKPRSLVKAVYLKLNSGHIKHILTRFKEQQHRINNKTAYLKTMLYNAYSKAQTADVNQSREYAAIPKADTATAHEDCSSEQTTAQTAAHKDCSSEQTAAQSKTHKDVAENRASGKNNFGNSATNRETDCASMDRLDLKYIKSLISKLTG